MSKRNYMDLNNKNTKKQKIELNKYDPILLNKIGKYIYTYTRSNGLTVVYNIESLIEYMLSTGNFIEPETKIEFSDIDLIKLDEKALKYGFNYESTFEARKNKKII